MMTWTEINSFLLQNKKSVLISISPCRIIDGDTLIKWDIGMTKLLPLGFEHLGTETQSNIQRGLSNLITAHSGTIG